MHVLVTGAFGNLGSLLIDALLGEGHSVTCFDLKTKVNEKVAAQYKGRIDTQWGDIRDAVLVQDLVAGKGAVIHLAAMIPPFSEANPKLSWGVNVEGTEHLLRAIESADKPPLFVFSSSFAVFGNRQKDPPPRTLDDPLIATDNYSEQKIACENMIVEKDFDWVILRLGAMVDTRMRHSDKQQIRLGLRASASSRLEYIHPLDAATAIVNTLTRPEAHNKVHLIGGGATCQVNHLEFFNAMSGSFGLVFKASDFGDQELCADWVDTRESQRLLHYQKHTFDDFRRENYQHFRWLRYLVKPYSPIIKWGMKLL